MKTHSVLLYFPGFPFDPQALTPSRPLASVAASLLEQGHETRILDFGTVETVARLVAGKPSAHIERVAGDAFAQTPSNPLQALHMLWHLRGADRAFRQLRAKYALEIVNRLATMRGLHFAAFMLNTVEDVYSTLSIVRPLRERCPRMRIVGFGNFAQLFGAALAGERNAFDCLCTGDPEATLVALAERIDAPHLWAQISNLVFANGSRVLRTRADSSTSLSTLPSPAYEPDAYPALRAEQKIRVFTIDECRPSSIARDFHADTPRIRSVLSVCNEMWRVGTLFGARAYHFSSESAPASHVSAVAHELLRRNMSAVYTRACSIAHAVPATFPALRSSGCLALSFPVHSGSQRLLDFVYGNQSTVTDIERVLHCCKSVGMFAIARFTYPCAEDDYHTRAETVRIIERTRPHAAPVELPGVLPAFHDIDESNSSYQRCLATARKFPAARGAWKHAQHGAATGQYEVSSAYHGLIAEIEQRGVNASLPDHIVRLACIMADVGREHELGARLQNEFMRGDAMGIAALVDLVNEVACVPAKRMALRPHDGERLAVGN